MSLASVDPPWEMGTESAPNISDSERFIWAGLVAVVVVRGVIVKVYFRNPKNMLTVVTIKSGTVVSATHLDLTVTELVNW